MQSINPATEERIADYPEASPGQVDQILASAEKSYRSWRSTDIARRAMLMKQAGKVLRTRRDELSRLMTSEMGKPITASEAEIDKCAGCCEYFAEHGAKFLKPRMIGSDAGKSYVRFDPVGPVLAIMPWNFPFWQVIRFAAPTLVAGNVGVLKHASNVPGCAIALQKVFAEAGFPAGVFSSLLISDNAVAEKLIEDLRIRAVSLTGSDRAGRAVSSTAGRVLKKTVMELGGSDPFIVLVDADIDSVAKIAAEARCINNGQSCIAAKRFIIEHSIADRFESAMIDAMTKMKIGDPMDRATQIGPLARLDLLENLHKQVEKSVSQGAKLRLGGSRIDCKGYFYPPTVLSNVTPGMTAFDEETFGPVAAIIRAKDPEDCVRLANLSLYGLGASIWTNDLARAEVLAEKIESGAVFINGIVKSDSRLPFGGVKNSGWGRELSEYGIHEFVNIKTVWIK
jgi:succinate-semialdehyde dehydrogenase/glutarate-semialdehyde dehydrogenase